MTRYVFNANSFKCCIWSIFYSMYVDRWSRTNTFSSPKKRKPPSSTRLVRHNPPERNQANLEEIIKEKKTNKSKYKTSSWRKRSEPYVLPFAWTVIYANLTCSAVCAPVFSSIFTFLLLPEPYAPSLRWTFRWHKLAIDHHIRATGSHTHSGICRRFGKSCPRLSVRRGKRVWGFKRGSQFANCDDRRERLNFARSGL